MLFFFFFLFCCLSSCVYVEQALNIQRDKVLTSWKPVREDAAMTTQQPRIQGITVAGHIRIRHVPSVVLRGKAAGLLMGKRCGHLELGGQEVWVVGLHLGHFAGVQVRRDGFHVRHVRRHASVADGEGPHQTGRDAGHNNGAFGGRRQLCLRRSRWPGLRRTVFRWEPRVDRRRSKPGMVAMAGDRRVLVAKVRREAVMKCLRLRRRRSFAFPRHSMVVVRVGGAVGGEPEGTVYVRGRRRFGANVVAVATPVRGDVTGGVAIIAERTGGQLGSFTVWREVQRGFGGQGA